jgi:hypothetical protein
VAKVDKHSTGSCFLRPAKKHTKAEWKYQLHLFTGIVLYFSITIPLHHLRVSFPPSNSPRSYSLGYFSNRLLSSFICILKSGVISS